MITPVNVEAKLNFLITDKQEALTAKLRNLHSTYGAARPDQLKKIGDQFAATSK